MMDKHLWMWETSSPGTGERQGPQSPGRLPRRDRNLLRHPGWRENKMKQEEDASRPISQVGISTLKDSWTVVRKKVGKEGRKGGRQTGNRRWVIPLSLSHVIFIQPALQKVMSLFFHLPVPNGVFRYTFLVVLELNLPFLGLMPHLHRVGTIHFKIRIRRNQEVQLTSKSEKIKWKKKKNSLHFI